MKQWIANLSPKKTDFDDYRLIFSSSEIHLIELFKMKLTEEQIFCLVINKRDSTYNNFGEIELYVKFDDVIRAKHILEV
jgi:hypothetical protein